MQAWGVRDIRATVHLRPIAFLLAGAVGLAIPARADEAQDLARDLEDAVAAAAAASAHVLEDDRPRCLIDLDAAIRLAEEADSATGDAALGPLLRGRKRRVGSAVGAFARSLADARGRVVDPAGSQADAAQALRRALREGGRALRRIGAAGADGFLLLERRTRRPGFTRPGARLRFQVKRADGCVDPLQITVVNDDGDALSPTAPTPRRDRFALNAGPDAGAARVEVSACGATHVWRVLNLGPPGTLRKTPGWGDGGSTEPEGLTYGEGVLSFRVDEAAPAILPNFGAGDADTFGVAPALPPGMSLDPATGALSGPPDAAFATTAFTVTASNDAGETEAVILVQGTAALPEGMEFLEPGFDAEPWLPGLQMPVKMAFAPDGRLFFNELGTGRTRIVDPQGVLLETPFATTTVLSGGERGLIGLAFSPDFAQSGHVFVFAHVAAGGGKQDRGQVIRYTATGDAGGSPAVIVDDLPMGIIQNGGDVQFGPDGRLYVTVGDTTDENLSQQDGSLAGRVLRYAADGSIPADNPDPASPEWCRGLRNVFDMTFHPTTGGLFATENGPVSDDELNFIIKGRNYEWGPLPVDFPGALTGVKLAEWSPVIVPTGLTFHSGASFGPGFANNIFLLGYDHADIRRLPMSGTSFLDVDDELPFARWDGESTVDHKPLDVVEAPDGSLLVSTFTAIWQIRRAP